MENNKTFNKKKLIYLLASIVITYIVPLIIVLWKFDIFKSTVPNAKKFTILGLFFVVVLAFKFSSQLKDFMNNTVRSVKIKKAFTFCKNALWCVLLIFVLECAKDQIINLEIVVIVIVACFTIGNFFYQDYKEELKKEDKYIQKQDMLKTLKEYEESK